MSAPPIALYVHLPWCTAKCPYCDFNSYELRGAPSEQGYVDALLADLEQEIALGGAVTISTLFIGGGTPSLFSGAAIARLLDGIAVRAALAGDAEVTLEANPGSAEAARFRDYRAAGVNRLSLGIQSFDDARLAALGRVHGGDEARAAIAAAIAAGFDNFNLDLMFGLPGAGRGDAVGDLREALAYSPPHLSWYQLTLEAGTAFGRRPPPLPDHDAICDDYDEGLALLGGAGYVHYEISAHARPGREARHNLNYWCFGDYIGIGAGAHGKRRGAMGIVRRAKPRHPDRYMKTALAGGADVAEEHVTGAEAVAEYMLNALRLRSGFAPDEIGNRTGVAADDPLVAAPLADALARGWLERDDRVMRPTALGFRFLDELQLLFVAPETGVNRKNPEVATDEP